MQLHTERLLLRPFSEADAEAAHPIYADPEVMRFVAGGADRDLDATRARMGRYARHLEQFGFSKLAVIERSTGRLVGDCGLSRIDGDPGPSGVDVGYKLARDVWGRGYASEAAFAATRWGFADLGLDRIIAIVLPEHLASVRVIEKLGLHDAGTGVYFGREHRVFAADRAAWLAGNR